MTLISKCIMAGYVLLHILFIVALDISLKKGVAKREAYARARWAWIVPFVAMLSIPVLAALLPEGKIALLCQRIGNVFLALDMHIVGIWILLKIILLIFWKKDRKKAHPQSGIVALILAMIIGVIVPVYGMFHANDPQVTYETADLQGTGGEGHSLRIALIADLHLSVNSHLSTTEKLVERLNAQKPDIVVVAGDIFTSSYQALRDADAHAAALDGIQAPMGVYAVYGNHDVEERLFAGFAIRPVKEAFRSPEMDAFMEKSGFTMLKDEVVPIADGALWLAGRLDKSKVGDGTADRLSAEELFSGIDRKKPILVIEHEPVEYPELAAAGADMVFSGHTHNGQIFPGSVYVKIANRNGYGKKNIAGMDTFVTSGVGTFGPPMRTGCKSEIMIVDVQYGK